MSLSPPNPSTTTSYDVLVVGAGPTGLSCAIEVKKKGFRVVVIEKGCLVNSLYHYPTNMTFFTTPELLEIGNLPMTAVRDKPTRNEALKYYRRVTSHYELDIQLYQKVTGLAGKDGHFQVATSKRSEETLYYQVKKIILATGYYDVPVAMNVPGEHLGKVFHYYEDPHPFYNTDLAVVGGRNSAAIIALETYRAGARVTLIHREKQLSDQIKYWVRPDIENRMKNGEICAYLESNIEEITERTITLHTPNGKLIIPNDFVLAATGYQPDLSFLEQAGITFDPESQRPRTNPDTNESQRPGIYLAGVIVAGMHTNEIFIENGRFHGKRIAVDIATKLD